MNQGTCEIISIPPREATESVTFNPVLSRVFVSPAAPSGATIDQQMRIVELSGTLDFWNDQAEDVYKADDDRAI